MAGEDFKTDIKVDIARIKADINQISDRVSKLEEDTKEDLKDIKKNQEKTIEVVSQLKEKDTFNKGFLKAIVVIIAIAPVVSNSFNLFFEYKFKENTIKEIRNEKVLSKE